MQSKKLNNKTGTQGNKKLVVLLDAHAILHRAYHAMAGFATKDGRPTGALYGFITMVLRIREQFSPDYVIACFDLEAPTFRHASYEGYKAGRKKSDDALIEQLQAAQDMCEQLSIPVYAHEGFEADDMLGTIVEQVKSDKNTEIIIASGDMDTLQLVRDPQVKVFTLKKGSEAGLFDESAVKEKYSFTPDQIRDYKGLAGDSSDNIIGIQGIGDKTAKELIKHFGSIENIYKELKHDRKKLLDLGFKERIVKLLEDGEEEALFSKTLATIRKDAPVHFAIPEKSWDESLVKEKFLALCDQYEFRSLRSKLSLIEAQSSGEDTLFAAEEKEESLPKDVLARCKVMGQLLESESTDPDIETLKGIANTDDVNKIEELLIEKLKEQKLYTLYKEVEEPVIAIIDAMEVYGIGLDVKKLTQMSIDLHKQVKILEKKIHTEAGEEFTISSPKQLGVILYEKLNLGSRIKKTSTGAKTTNAKQLEVLIDEHPIVPLILEYRELTKLLSTYIDLLPRYVQKDGRVHAHFVQTGSATGRFSCEDPNLQNLPVKSELGKGVKEAFVAAKGKQLISCDYAQVDLRSAAILSGDENLIDIFMRHVDVHTGTAAKVFGVKENEITPQMRRKAKAINFGILYGMGVTSLKEGMGVDRKEAQEFYDTYKGTFVRLMQYLEEVKVFAWKHGYTTTLLGRHRNVPLLKSPLQFLRAQGERIAINAPMQGTSADIIKLGMIDTSKLIEDKKLIGKVSLILQIHDELVFEADEDIAESISKELKTCMEQVLSSRKLATLPLEVSVSVGKNLKAL